jgi:hypothetical protein
MPLRRFLDSPHRGLIPAALGAFIAVAAAAGASADPRASGSFTLSCPTVAVSPSALPAASVGAAYLETVSASGGAAPYSFAVTSGALPAGLSLDSGSGEISGTPTTGGAFGFTITASDANTCTGSRAYSLPVCPSIDVLPTSLPPVTVGNAYSQTMSSSAGSAPFTFTITSGTLPAGLTLSPAGLLSGTPTVTGSFPVTVRVFDFNGCDGSRAYTLDVPGVPAAIGDLTAAPRTSGNDADGTVKIDLSFTGPAFASTYEVYRAPFGHYPQYDDAGGSVPPLPSYPPGPPWAVTGVAASGQSDEPATRDFYYYVAFSKNSAGAVSPVSNRTSGTANYALGDVSDGITPGAGDNVVGLADLSLLGASYGISGSAITSAGVDYLDVGPTTDLQVTSRPFTDGRIDFEDLIVFATNFGVVSAPLAIRRAADEAAATATAAELVSFRAPSLVEGGDAFEVALDMTGAGRVQGLSVALEWDPAVVEPVDVSGGGWIESQGGVVLSARPGSVDGALLGARDRGLTGSGRVATFRFRALREGYPGLRIASVSARDAANRPLPEAAWLIEDAPESPARDVLLAPSPNPSRSGTTLGFALARPSRVELSIYSVEGRRVRALAAGSHPAGVYRFRWTGDDDGGHPVAPGVYYLHLSTDARKFTRALVYLK